MTTAMSYIAAFMVTALANMIALLVVVPFKPVILRVRCALSPVNFAYAFFAGIGGVWAYTALAENTFLDVAYFMLLLPALFLLWNDLRRVNLAKKGYSGVKRLLDQTGEPESYDQATDIRAEQAAEFGRIVGFLAGLALFVGGAPFFA